MDFLILRPLSPKTGYHFFEGGGVGGGSKVFAQKAPSSGEAYRYHTTAGRMVTQPTQSFRSAVRILVGRLLAAAAAAAPYSPLYFELPTKKTPVSCITIRPLLGLRRKVSPLLGAASATDKKPKPCVSV